MQRRKLCEVGESLIKDKTSSHQTGNLSACVSARSGDSANFQFSGSSHRLARETFEFEDRTRLRQISAVLSYYPEDWNRVRQKTLDFNLALASLFVEEPLVDLDPLKSSFLFNFLTKLFVDFAVMVIQQIN